ncbi:MAG: hypothetical protein WC356_04635, partial [Candidatus Micrarchaeia archaeon]
MKKYIIGIILIVFLIFGCVGRSDILYNTTGANRDVLYDLNGSQMGLAPNQTNYSKLLEDFCVDSGVCISF